MTQIHIISQARFNKEGQLLDKNPFKAFNSNEDAFDYIQEMVVERGLQGFDIEEVHRGIRIVVDTRPGKELILEYTVRSVTLG